MATRYVGIGGNDGNSGLTWALRKLTSNGAEDTPVVAGDLVYVGPGVYRETLTVDVNGGAGTAIVYVADVTGEHTDGVGGIVRITGSDNDQTAARGNCISADSKNYRTFRGFLFDTTSAPEVVCTGTSTNWIFEDCFFGPCAHKNIFFSGVQSNHTIRRCMFQTADGFYALHFTNAATVDNTGHLIENCLFLSGAISGLYIERIGGITVRNSSFVGRYYRTIWIAIALAVGQQTDVNNCIFAFQQTALVATALGEIVEDYNTFYVNGTNRSTVNVGANSVTYPPLFLPPILHSGVSQVSGFKFPWWFGELSEWSQIQAITGANEPTEELRGIARPVTASKNSWGATQFFDAERETGTVRTGSASIVLHDAGRHQIFVPVTNVSTTIKVYVYREANYAGNNPQMIIKQPGVADRVTTDVAAASQWNLLTDTFTPAALPPYAVVELVSRNTAVALAYETMFDDLDVS